MKCQRVEKCSAKSHCARLPVAARGAVKSLTRSPLRSSLKLPIIGFVYVRHVKSIITTHESIVTHRELSCHPLFVKRSFRHKDRRALYVSSDGIFAVIFDAEFSRNFPEFSRYAITCSDDVACRAYFINTSLTKVNLF